MKNNSAALKKPVCVALGDAERERLDAIAKRYSVSRSWAIRRAVAMVLARPELLMQPDRT